MIQTNVSNTNHQVSKSNTNHQVSALQTEVARLRDELQMRDQLVQQLSQELFRLVKGDQGATANPELSAQHQAELQSLREQLQAVEQQVGFYQEQLASRDADLQQSQQAVQELTDRCQMLEQVVQELPQVYRRKFAERIAPIKERVAKLQQENRQLHAELQSVSYRLAMKTRHVDHIDLPTFSRSMVSLPSFGNAS